MNQLKKKKNIYFYLISLIIIAAAALYFLYLVVLQLQCAHVKCFKLDNIFSMFNKNVNNEPNTQNELEKMCS